MASIINSGKFLARDGNGVPYAGGKLYTYLAGSAGATPKATYTDSLLGTPNANPVVLDADGRADVWLEGGSYLFEFKDSSDNLIWSVDNYKDIPKSIDDGFAALNVANIAALRLISGDDAEKAFVNGYFNEGDEGGGEFYWDSASTATDNGGTIIQATGVTTGRWIRNYNGAVDVLWFGAVNDGVVDCTTAFTNAIAASLAIELKKAGTYKITDELELASDSNVDLASGVQIQQFTADKRIFYADNKDNVWINANGAILYGEGTWSAGWTGNSGHADRGIELISCTRSGITNAVIKNMANAGISIIGGDRISLIGNIIEGTHEYSTVIPSNGNFQNGYYLKHDSVEGNLTNLNVIGGDISGCAQGILIEGYGALTQSDDMLMNIIGVNVHDIPGQHGAYIQVGKINLIMTADNCDLDGVKIQDNGTVQPRDIHVQLIASNCGSHALEIQAAAAGGSVKGITGKVISQDCQRGVGFNGDTSTSTVEDCDVEILARNSTQYGAIIQGDASATMKNISLKVDSLGSGRHGVYVTAAAAEEITLYPKVRESGSATANTWDGIIVEGATQIDIIEPDVSDSGGNQRYALFISSATAQVRVKNFARLIDGTTHDVRSSGDILEWPTDVTLSSANTVSRMQDLKRFSKSPHSTIATNQSTSATNVTLWQTEVADDSSWYLQADVVANAKYVEAGTHDGANNVAILSDSTAAFTVNELVGSVVYNTTDGSSGTITANTATTITATLAGGTDNDWDTNDAYVVGGRSAWNRVVLCSRDSGGNVVIDGQDNFITPIESAGSTANLTWEASGTTIRLRANSGAATPYNWECRVKYVDSPAL